MGARDRHMADTKADTSGEGQSEQLRQLHDRGGGPSVAWVPSICCFFGERPDKCHPAIGAG
jgi:hypothetical protein